MAILSKIRERSLFLILVIGLALFAFVLDPSTLGDFFNSSKVNEIGEINGTSISREEFAKQVDAFKTQMGGRSSEMQAAKNVWNNMVREKIYKQQLENAGISLGEEDVWNEVKKAPFVQNNPEYQTAGVFDETKLKQFLADAKENNPQLWNSWTSYMARVKQNLERTTYDNLVNAGLGASLLEGKTNYYNNQVKISGKYTYVPYNSISDSLVKVTEGDVKNYINKHSKDFQVEEARDIAYVKFPIKPSAEDEEAIKKEVASLIEDREEYSNAAKTNVTVKGLRNSDNINEFFSENKSDTKLNDQFVFKNQLPNNLAEGMIEGQVGDVFGPYKNRDMFKIAKITAVTKMPDSVKASHMLIPFVGSRAATAETKQTEEEAKKTVDSILAVVKKRPAKFASLAKEFSKDQSNAEKGGDLGWFTYNRMMPSFRDFCFENKKGDMGVVKTPYGFHVIKIENQKNLQNAIKLAEFGRKIEASEATENMIFQKAEEFSQAVSKDAKKFYATAKEKGLSSRSAVGLKALDENISGLGNERQIITWAFDRDNKIGTFKRFDVEEGYAVVIISGKQEKGLMTPKKATSRVKSILIKEKKASLINAKMNGSSLEAIAKENNRAVRTLSGVSLKSPMISGVGNEPKVIGAMLNAQNGKLYNKIDGNSGVFAFEVTEIKKPVELPNYASERTRVAEKLKNKQRKMFEALKEASDIEDNRAFYYGIQ